MESNPEWNDFSNKHAQPEDLSRREFLSLLTALGAVGLSACAPPGPQSHSLSAPPTAALTALPKTEVPNDFEGYSIFHQTMVEMPWLEIKKAAQDGAIVLLPIGIIEEHGPHMGLGADIYQAYFWSKLTRRALNVRGIQALIAPPYYWGINVSTASFPGSFTVRSDTMRAVLYDIHESLNRWGFKYVFSLNQHSDSIHYSVLSDALQKVRIELGIGAFLATPDVPVFPGSSRLSQATDIHAGAYETAKMALEFPMDVNIDLARTLPPSNSFQPLGYYGDPASFDLLNANEIRKWVEDCGAATAEWIQDFLNKKK